jgi:hypothetical protein
MSKGRKQPSYTTYQAASEAAREFAGRVARGEIKGARLLTRRSAKVDKSGGAGFLSVILHLQPAAVFVGLVLTLRTCPWATAGCVKVCLQYAGRMRFGGSFFARMWRTWLLVDYPEIFGRMLIEEIRAAEKSASRKGLGFTARLNGTSDLSWESLQFAGRTVFEHLPTVQWYDYTKSADRAADVKVPQYHLVYSHNENSDPAVESKILRAGGSIAMVFDTKGGDLPEVVKIGRRRFPVVDGDVTDLRHLDPKGVIVGLKYKKAFCRATGKAIQPPAGFVVGVDSEGV